MRAGAPPDLVARLRPHVRHRHREAGAAWWAPAPVRRHPWRGVPARLEQLTLIVERLALLIDVGDGPPAAVAEVAAVGRGRVAGELRPVADALAGGRSLAHAVDDWARRTGCGHLGVLAADLEGCTSSDAVAGALWRCAAALRRTAHQRRLRMLRRRVGLVWLLAAVVCAASIAPLLPWAG